MAMMDEKKREEMGGHANNYSLPSGTEILNGFIRRLIDAFLVTSCVLLLCHWKPQLSIDKLGFWLKTVDTVDDDWRWGSV
jgi:hypothetical protein